MITSTLVYSMFNHQLYAAVVCGVISGTGTGIVLRSVGSGGGLDIIGIILFQKFNIYPGCGGLFKIVQTNPDDGNQQYPVETS